MTKLSPTERGSTLQPIGGGGGGGSRVCMQANVSKDSELTAHCQHP